MHNVSGISLLKQTIRCFILVICLPVIFHSATAQIRFPDGNNLYLETNNNLLYLETRILFNTGKYKASDYRWEKLSDSLESKWLVTACFNGDCRNDLLQSGNFITDYGLNDTTCFIAFHVETHDLNGAIRIKYRIYNTKEPKDSGTLSYYIKYQNTAGISTPTHESLVVYHSPDENCLKINGLATGYLSMELLDTKGRCLETWNDGSMNNGVLPLPDVESGIYIVRMNSGNKERSIRIVLP